MGTTTLYGLRYPEPTDVPNVQPDMKNLAQDIDSKVIVVPIGYSLEWDYGAAQIPSWALLQYGQAISRTTYSALAALASAASYPHGSGDGSTTFNIADKRGRISAGKDDMGGTAASRITAAISGTAGTVLGAAVGNEGVTLATAQIPSHSHSIATGTTNLATESADHAHYTTTGGVSSNENHLERVGYGGPGGGWGIKPADNSTGDGATVVSNTGYISSDHGHSGDSGGRNTAHNHSDSGHGHTFPAQGGGGAHLNMSPTIIVNRIVRAL